MRRIMVWLLSTVAGLVLLFSYRTSTMGPAGAPVPAVSPPAGAPVPAVSGAGLEPVTPRAP